MNLPDNKTRNKSNSLIIRSLIAGLTLGIVITFLLMMLFEQHNASSDKMINSSKNSVNSPDGAEKQPLYWVAPMDANYRRDQPGKSPMGMDLIPYYGSKVGDQDKDEGPGTIRITPNVVNNLGVRTATATKETLNTTIDTVGYVTVDENKLIHIHPRIEGWIEKLHVNAIGETVKKGQPLYDIYSPELVNAQEELLLALDNSIERLIDAAESRLIALHIPQSTIDHIKKTKKSQQYVTFHAPQDGVIKTLNVRAGFYVQPDTMMLSIVDLSKVWVKAEVFEQDILQVQMGNSALMTIDSLPARQWQGKVEHIHPMLNATTRTGVVRLHFDNEDRLLKPNMFANIRIENSEREQVLQIPSEALIRTGHQNRVVLALGDGYFKSIAVAVGRISGGKAEIISGLREGEEVVSSAQFLLDSESSKTSDFSRINTREGKSTESATVRGIVIDVMINQRMVTIKRERIKKWQRAAATVDFSIADNVDINLFRTNAYLMFTFEIHQGEFVIVNAMAVSHSDTKNSMIEVSKPLNKTPKLPDHEHSSQGAK